MSFIDSDLLYRGALEGRFDCITITAALVNNSQPVEKVRSQPPFFPNNSTLVKISIINNIKLTWHDISNNQQTVARKLIIIMSLETLIF